MTTPTPLPRTELLKGFIDASARCMKRHYNEAVSAGRRGLGAAALLGTLATGCAELPSPDMAHEDTSHEVPVVIYGGGQNHMSGSRVVGRLAGDLTAPDGTVLAAAGTSVHLEVTVPVKGGARVRIVHIEAATDPEAPLLRTPEGSEITVADWKVTSHRPYATQVGHSPPPRLQGAPEGANAETWFVRIPEADTLRIPVGQTRKERSRGETTVRR